MGKYKGKYRIESNRASFWDYSAPADYFITICTVDRECIFGIITNGIMVFSEYGKIVRSEIIKMPEYNKRVILNEWVVMPNHIHGIITLGDYGYDNGVWSVGDVANHVKKIHEFSLPSSTPSTIPSTAPTTPTAPTEQSLSQWWHNPNHQPTIDDIKQYRKYRRKMIILKILGKFKQQTSKQINIKRNTPKTKNWQANYHDHIIRDDRAYQNIKNYIINNPAKWTADKFNPDNPKSDK